MVLRIYPENEGQEQIKICNPDSFEGEKTYTFDPPLDIATVSFLNEHFCGHPPKMQKPTFLVQDIRKAGLKEGKFIGLAKTSNPRIRTGSFVCTMEFRNRATGNMETTRYVALVKFSRGAAEGVTINVREKVVDALHP